MANIDAERAWMRQHGAQQRIENERVQARRDAEERQRVERTCPYCFHDRHEAPWGGGDVTVLYCRTSGCVCGVPPCQNCQSRWRVFPHPTTEQCANCGESWLMSPIA